jgi:hypothetical protein
VLYPNWDNAGPPLLAFLVYDLTLLVPFIHHFSSFEDAHRTPLIVYSMLLAIYYLFADPTTRLCSPSATVAAEPEPDLQTT